MAAAKAELMAVIAVLILLASALVVLSSRATPSLSVLLFMFFRSDTTTVLRPASEARDSYKAALSHTRSGLNRIKRKKIIYLGNQIIQGFLN